MKDQQLSSKHGFAVGIVLTIAMLLISTSGGVLAQDSEELTLEALGKATWTLVAFGDPYVPQGVLPDSEITAIFDLDEGKVSGDAGCNSYFAGVGVDGNTITVSAVGSTMMACAEDVMAQEQTFLATLEAAQSHAITNGQLWITAGEQVLVFGPQMVLENTTWTLVTYGDPDAPQVVLPDSEISVEFDLDEGRVSGNAGCNRYFAGFELGGNRIAFSAIGSTMMACEEDLMAQEQGFLAILEAAESYVITDGQLWITAGEQILVFIAQPDSSTGALIVITAPQNDADLDDSQPVHIAGIGRELFEGNVVVRVLDAEGNILIEQPATAQGENVGIGGPGSWTIDLTTDVEPGTSAQIMAFSPSPEDGSLLAGDRVDITFSSQD